MNHFPIRLWHVMKCWFYATTSDYQLSSWTEKKLQIISQSHICTKIRGHGHCLVVCCWSDPLRPSESWQNHYIWEVCSANRWDALKTAMPAASTGEQKGPNSSSQPRPTTHRTTNASKVERTGPRSFASSAIFTWPLASWLPAPQVSWQLFAGKMLPQPAGGRKCFPRVHWIPKRGFLCYRNKQTYFSLAKMCWL